MRREISRHLSMFVLMFIAATTLLFVAWPVQAAPRAQTTVPNLRVSADATITVTVAITDGQVIVIPIDLNIVARNLGGTSDLAIITGVEQQAGLFIGVVPDDPIPATIELTDASGVALTPASSGSNTTTSSPATVGGTHVANANSNLRAGPGTNFERIGRVPAGGTVIVVGQNDDGTWLQLDDGSWIAEFLVDPVSDATPPAAAPDEDETLPDEELQEDELPDDELPNGEDDEELEEAAPEPEAEPTTISNQAALAVYLVSIAEIGAGAGDAVDTLQAMIQNPQPLNPTWRNDVVAQLDALSTALNQYLALTPVPGYEDLHAEVTAVALTCQEAVNYLMTGLEDPRTIDPNAAIASVQSCATQATGLSAYLETIQ